MISSKGTPQQSSKYRNGGSAVRWVVALSLMSWAAAAPRTRVSAATPPAQVYYVPFPETELLEGLRAIANPVVPSSPVISVTAITAVANNTIIYYDHWENGYDADISNPLNLYSGGNPGGTQIWGDGNPGNGAPPGVPSDLINAGTVIILASSVPIPRDASNIFFDAADKFAATKPVSVSHSAWATGTGTRLAGAVEVFDSSKWGTDYRAPVGEDIADPTDHQMFEYTSLAIMAGEGGATIQIDKDADGNFEAVQALTEGQSYFVDGGVKVGGHVVSDKPVQVHILTGDISSTYESRDSALFPTGRWSTDFYTPVSTGSVVVPGFTPPLVVDASTTVWLYNPTAAPLFVSYTTRSQVAPFPLITTTLTVPGGPAGGYLPQIVPDRFGAHFSTSSVPFYAFSTTDSIDPNTGGQAWDWGFTLIPSESLTSQVQVGLGIGRDPTSIVNPTENGNPVWVTPVGNGDTPVTLYVDFDADPTTGALTDPNGNKYDAAGARRELERFKVYDPDGDQTGMLIYVLTPGVKLAAAWGQDPNVASIGEPGLDTGTSVPPAPEFSAVKGVTLAVDNDHDGLTGAGDGLQYTIVINNVSRAPVPDVVVQDDIPPGTTYVANSTFFKNAVGVTAPIPDDVSGTPFPLDGAGHHLDVTPLPIAGTYEVTFQVTVAAFADLQGICTIVNQGTASSGNTTFPFKATTPVCQAAHLIVIKHVINDNGGTKNAADFTMTIDGVTATGGNSFSGSEAPGTAKTLTTVGAYTVTEGAVSGYTQTSASADCSGTIVLGETKTCTITNDDNGPGLHLRKVVVNDNGGTALDTAWTLSAAGPTPLSGSTPVDSGASFHAGAYTLSESGPTGYTASDWVCVGGTQVGNQITVDLGGSATCTITNDDEAPALHLRKVVVNDNGGTALNTAWTLSAAGPTPLSGSTPVDSAASFQAGTYTLSESGPTGYTASNWVCVGGTQVGNQITVDLGGSATCTITNDDDAPALHLRKVVVNDNGGTALDTAWTLSAAGPTPLSGSTPVDSGASFQAGAYTLSESGPAGYTASNWVCVGGTQNGSSITVGSGQSATCTITNNDIAPRLTLNKVVVNDNGGTAAESAWTLTANGGSAGTLSGPGAAGASDVVSGATFRAGTYTLSESSATVTTGYTASAWSCVKNGQAPVTGSSITLANGDTATCTIINNDDAPSGEGCTPGYWKNNPSYWNETADSLVVKMPTGYKFITTTSFKSYFGLTNQQMAAAGIPLNATMLDVINLGGGGGQKLGRHGVSLLISIADGIASPFGNTQADFITLYNRMKTAFVSGAYEPLATQIADANNLSHQSCAVGETTGRK